MPKILSDLTSGSVLNDVLVHGFVHHVLNKRLISNKRVFFISHIHIGLHVHIIRDGNDKLSGPEILKIRLCHDN